MVWIPNIDLGRGERDGSIDRRESRAVRKLEMDLLDQFADLWGGYCDDGFVFEAE